MGVGQAGMSKSAMPAILPSESQRQMLHKMDYGTEPDAQKAVQASGITSIGSAPIASASAFGSTLKTLSGRPAAAQTVS